MASVTLKNVSKIFAGGVQAVDSMDLEIPDKEFCVLVGPSGCGKSTTLRMVAGLDEITEGEIRIGDRVVNNIAPKDRDVAMVFQNYALYPHMTVYKNMASSLIWRRFPKKEIDQRVREASQILGIETLLERKPKALSGGQRQRVAVGRAIVRNPKVFLFDEPLSNLDAKLRVQMRIELSKLHSRLQTTMIYVTHDQVEAMTMGDRIVIMTDGRIQQVADPITLYDQPANLFVAGFIGSPAMNFFKGRCEFEGGRAWFSEGTFRLPLAEKFGEPLRDYDGKEIVFGIRPENIHSLENKPADLTEETVVEAEVEVVEPMGAESYVYLHTPKSSFVARHDPHVQVEEKSHHRVVFNIARAHVFDKETEKTII